MTLKTEEDILLNNLIKGDVYAFEEVYKKFNKKVYNFSFRYLKNRSEAESVVQEVFLKLWDNSKKLDKNSNLNAWLFTVTFNVIRKYYRKLAVEKRYIKEYSAKTKSSYNEISEIEYMDMLEKASHLIDKLPPQQKKIFLLRKDKSLSNAELAAELKLSKKTIENHLNRARTFLKNALIAEGILSPMVIWFLVNC